MEEITTEEALRRIAAGSRLYDVREQGEWDDVHAPQATLVPMSELSERWTEIQPTDEPAITVCHSGMRSARVVAALEQSGVPAVNLAGGMVAWEAAGAPVERADAQRERGHEH
ncbi:rhodanese-related sulfurtransferase [Curtobacterium sp. PhB130]|uniref:rhodanese-like domain-containing protein n=1 Tax=Curtobacterium sp. PhB130 TaxID=2485178 RepID=UPI000F4C719F|nr:rhodanese-like domain-containing protein [Curtobacterium sp. PhB130]ROS73792.1 rhodanese-related sulfurtransferase [Curtobacterium sp. PhB130]